jgi:hypothetical protein
MATESDDGHAWVENLIERSGLMPQPWGPEPPRDLIAAPAPADGSLPGYEPSSGPGSALKVRPRQRMVVYDVEPLARSDWEELVRTRFGQLWLICRDPMGVFHVPVTMGEAAEWARLRGVYGDLREALALPAGDVPQSIRLDLPRDLLGKVTGLALMDGDSRNNWITRCLERVANKPL